MQTQHHPYLSRLDHLRFLAASLVVLFHFFHHTQGDLRSGNPLVSLIDEGHTGIALFMVISGFIFTVIAGDKDIHYAGFIRNRIIRIYPLLIVAACLQLFVSTYNDHRNYGFLQLLGWLMPFRSETIGLSPYFQQMWTIWVELQFYLLFPFLLLFARRYGSRYLWGVLGLLFVLRALVFAASGEVRYIAYETLFGRLDQFVVGMLLGRVWVAKAQSAQTLKTVRSIHVLWLVPAALLVLAVLHAFSMNVGYTELKSPLWVVWPLVEGAVWGAFVWAYLLVRWPGPEPLKASIDKGLALLGAVSFSTYVFHNLVLAAYNNYAGIVHFTGLERFDIILTGVLVVLPLVLLMSAITYGLIEKPFLSLRNNYLSSRRPTIKAELQNNN
jgi:peptidoglycan/LPS O-acetylase OafA/YrhL